MTKLDYIYVDGIEFKVRYEHHKADTEEDEGVEIESIYSKSDLVNVLTEDWKIDIAAAIMEKE